jgi:two-component system cell cycle sensor histidine kinase/response regulator CckA
MNAPPADVVASAPRGDPGVAAARPAAGPDAASKKLLDERFQRTQRLESIGMLASGIAHDLNNVLAPIILAAPVLREHATNPEDLRIITSLEKSAERGVEPRRSTR